MRRLTAAERVEWRKRLEEPMTPAEMIARVDELDAIIGWQFHAQAGLEFARDAWTAARVAKMRSAESVRLWPGDRPDFEMTESGVARLFEVVEADEPGRHRGAEYKALLAEMRPGEVRIEDDPESDVKARARLAPAMLEKAARDKADGDYDSSIGLVIHLNLMEYSWFRSDIEAAMATAIAPVREAFSEVLILWQRRLYQFQGPRFTLYEADDD